MNPETFSQMVKVVENHEKLKKKTGRPSCIKFGRASFDDSRILKRVQNVFSGSDNLGDSMSQMFIGQLLK